MRRLENGRGLAMCVVGFMMALALVTGDPSLSDADGASSKKRTVVSTVSPLGSNQGLRRDLRVARTVDADTEQGGLPCTSPSVTGATYRCFGADNRIYSSCWVDVPASRGGNPVLDCWDSPVDQTVVRLRMNTVLPDFLAPPERSQPWALRLVTGEVCYFLSGAASQFDGQRVSYGCASKRSPKFYLLATPRRSSPYWDIRAVRGTAPQYTDGGRRRVKQAWFGRPSPILRADEQ